MALVLVLTTSAWAQEAETPAPPPEALATAPDTPADPADTPPDATAAPEAAPIPTDPMELVRHALANAREPQQCRFAFTRLQTTGVRVEWSESDTETTVRFDPRLPIGQRVALRTSRYQGLAERAAQREDRKAQPIDLMALTVEGSWTFENVALRGERSDRYVYSFTPRAIAEYTDDRTVAVIEQLVGTLEVSRETGRVMGGVLEGTVRVLGFRQRVLQTYVYAPGANDFVMVRNITVATSMTSSNPWPLPPTTTETTTSDRIADVEPICDPAEVARINEAEAAARAASTNRRR